MIDNMNAPLFPDCGNNSLKNKTVGPTGATPASGSSPVILGIKKSPAVPKGAAGLACIVNQCTL